MRWDAVPYGRCPATEVRLNPLLGALALIVAVSAGPAWAADAAQGQALYTAKCSACHGTDGKGTGPAARALPRKPRDMTAAAFWAEMTDATLRSIIEAGKPGSPMRGYPMRDDQMEDLVAYLRTFEPK